MLIQRKSRNVGNLKTKIRRYLNLNKIAQAEKARQLPTSVAARVKNE
jgi:hypothetical protein